MYNVSVLNVKPGSKLTKDVFTPLGALLFHKETILLARDLDILRAFLVDYVEIQEVGDKGIQAKDILANKDTTLTADKLVVNAPSISENERSSFVKEYERMVNLTKNGYSSVLAAGIPIYEIRNQLERMVSHIKEYHILSFTPCILNDYDYIYHNAVLCALSSYKLAQWCGLPQKDWLQAAFAGLFHDIGKIKVDPAVLYKPSTLTTDEIKEMRQHTKYGYQILKNVTGINEGVRLSALQHHEKVDGTGYPMNVESSKIHIYAKMVGIVDIFHAMTLNKVYRLGQSPYLVLEQIHAESFGKLDPELVQVFIKRVTEFHNGTVVRLSSDQIGEIVFSNSNNPTRPMVSINGDIINLEQSRHLYIEEIVDTDGQL
ncbi:HD-GYP domain-containing protein [Paenibacillus crassostreae]|uniref:HD family phosphohydrolase n=1 Tax=Paenibacillus crassostreae TaxID=1763538 RepID=A0A162L680_9BACL|nr:HD-GYP domain-containing protein [Paenibacillus crassostreae]AOZ92845.1 HD family phosphohydrolase [Paenibacillus crassostreae]OAB72065.1 HD family phosphohydrolase [Paenibacillus crassostreae]